MYGLLGMFVYVQLLSFDPFQGLCKLFYVTFKAYIINL